MVSSGMMRRRNARLILAMTAVVAVAGTEASPSRAAEATAASGAGSQALKLSKKAKNFNFGVTSATDPNTGNTLVVWSEIKPSDSSYSRVWGVFLKFNRRSGTFRKKKDFLISPNSGYHGNPSATWAEAEGGFAVAWDTRRVPGQPSDIYTRLVDGKSGKPKGTATPVVSDGNANWSGRFASNGLTGAAAELNLAYLSKAAGAAARTNDLQADVLDMIDGIALTGPILAQVQLDSSDGEVEFFRSSTGSLLNCGMLLVQTRDTDGSLAVGIVLARKGQLRFAGSVPGSLGDAAPSFAGGPTIHMWVGLAGQVPANAVEEALGRRLHRVDIDKDWRRIRIDAPVEPDPNLVLLMGATDAIVPAGAFESAFGDDPTATDVLGDMVNATPSGEVEIRVWNDDGTFGDSEPLFDHGRRLTFLNAASIAGVDSNNRVAAANNAAVFWLRTAGSRQEVHAHLFHLDSPQ